GDHRSVPPPVGIALRLRATPLDLGGLPRAPPRCRLARRRTMVRTITTTKSRMPMLAGPRRRSSVAPLRPARVDRVGEADEESRPPGSRVSLAQELLPRRQLPLTILTGREHHLRSRIEGPPSCPCRDVVPQHPRALGLHELRNQDEDQTQRPDV